MKAWQKKIIKNIRSQLNDLQWYGWVKGTDDTYERFDDARRLQIVGAMTILPKSFFKVCIRLFFNANSYSNKEFDPEKYDYVFEVTVLDELRRFGKKNVATIKFRKGQEEAEILHDLFKSVMKRTIFPAKSDRVSSQNKLGVRVAKAI